jgi:hypothetical protein
MKSKLLLYILIAITVIAVAAFIIYQLVYRGNSNITGGTGQTGSLPNTANQQFPSANPTTKTSTVSTFGTGGMNASSSKFGIVSNDPALDYFVDAANIVTLVKPDGTVEAITNNKATVISSSAIPNIISASFSYDGKKILVASRVGTTTQSSVFNLTTRAWTPLPNSMQSPAWSPTNYQIAYLTPSNSGFLTLSTIDAGATSTKPITVASLAMEDVTVQWPSKNNMIISDRPSAYTTGSIWLFNVSSKTLSPVVYENLGMESLWNASGSALLFSAGSNNAGGELTFKNASGTEKTLSFATLPSKCVFGPSTAASGTANPSVLIYCAVPRDQNTFSIARLPDEYDQNVYFTDDDFYRMDAGTGSLNQIFSFGTAGLSIDATRVKAFNNILFFINRYDQKIYALAL